MTGWLKKAFAVEAPNGGVPTDAQKAVVDKVCREVVKRHMTTPALIFLESFRPLNYIGSQVMYYFQPFISVILTGAAYQHFAEFLEQRKSVDYLCQQIEHFEAQVSNKGELKKPTTPDSEKRIPTKS